MPRCIDQYKVSADVFFLNGTSGECAASAIQVKGCEGRIGRFYSLMRLAAQPLNRESRAWVPKCG
jgi:hypothetical protein